MAKYVGNRQDYDYFRKPNKGYPKTIYWEIIAGPPGYKLNALQDHDVIFDAYDLKIRKLSESKDFPQ